MLFTSFLSIGLSAAASVALPSGVQVYGGSGNNGSGLNSLVPFANGATAAASAPPKVFYLTISTPKIKNSEGGLIAPFNGDFYVGNDYIEYCPNSTDCSRKLPKPTFSLQQLKQGTYLALNTSVINPFFGNGKAQTVYVHYTGQLRFFSPPQILVSDNEPFGNFVISKGTGGAKDTLTFLGDPAESVPPAPFMLCTEVGGPISNAPAPIYQVYVATKGFKAFVNMTKCVEIVPEITYSTDGAYQWL